MVLLTQSKSKAIITRSMCVISLIVFTDKDQRTRSISPSLHITSTSVKQNDDCIHKMDSQCLKLFH